MNRITINDKQYIFLETSEEVDCDQCDLDKDDMCNTSLICKHFHCLLHGYDGEVGVFKELKEEK